MKQSPENPTARRTVMVIAVSLVVAEIVQTIILSRVTGPQPARVIVAWMVRILLTSCLAYYLVRGVRWMRWLMVAVAVNAVVLTLIALIGRHYSPAALRLLIPWGVVTVLYYTAVTYMLIFSKQVAAHFVSHRIHRTP